ncbi:acyl-CoA-like ligand-binding transcription factor [Catenuloplanes atrovinosus]|uniref:AcrR family transcriptional regulator n=1 Tax=Catenuloplanes atrovinosus TaxID=137266 RepID=A0AAE4CFN9_9ACTN|nr:TetR family transcriptional regulator [Catenuloplanes atrovinosus]MDR7279840.1 AcrR family transcriptional regulator [Catenuloplanes atrovinosus]
MSSPGLRERKKQKTRWAIQEHALRLIAQQGYDATTVEQIAAAAEISPSTFFRYFPTKEDVVVEDRYDPVFVEIFDAQPAALAPLAALRTALHELIDRIPAEEVERARLRTSLVMGHPALRSRIYQNLTQTMDLVGTHVAARVGMDPADLRIRAFSGAVVGALVSVMTVWMDAGGRDELLALSDQAFDVLDRGLDAALR